jgi:hypothetical protein
MTFTDADFTTICTLDTAFFRLCTDASTGEETAWYADISDLTASISPCNEGYRLRLGVDVSNNAEEAFDCLRTFVVADLSMAIEKVHAYLNASLPLEVRPGPSDAYMLDVAGTHYAVWLAIWCESHTLDASAPNWIFGHVTRDNNAYPISDALSARYALLTAAAYLISKGY